MKFKKANIPAIDVLVADWKKYVDEMDHDPCLSVGYMSIGRIGKGGPETWKPVSLGFNVIVKENLGNINPVFIKVGFTQAADGVKWTISRQKDGKSTVLHSGVARDTCLVSGKPSPGMLVQRLTKVALLAVDLANVERKLMHI